MTLTSSLRRSGGSLIITIPQAYAEQNDLKPGSMVSIAIDGDALTLKPARRKRHSLSELLAATPEGLNRAQGWDDADMPAADRELL